MCHRLFVKALDSVYIYLGSSTFIRLGSLSLPIESVTAMPLSAFTFLSLCASVAAKNIVVTNDDGWATAQIRAQFNALVDAGYQVRVSFSGRWQPCN